jgi:hypothetical protein
MLEANILMVGVVALVGLNGACRKSKSLPIPMVDDVAHRLGTAH